MAITSTHNQYNAALARWKKNRAAVAGQDAIHAGGKDFIPDDNALDLSRDSRARFARLIERATWTPITSYTLQGLTGAVFRRPSQHNLDGVMDFIVKDADGTGQSLNQLGKFVIAELLTVARIGLLTEYPLAEEGLTAQQVSTQGLRPKITVYTAESIDNWAFEYRGGALMLTMIKLKEVRETIVDYEVEGATVYRVLRMNEANQYEQVVINENEETIEGPFIIRQADGTAFDYITFEFAGAENNLPNVDIAPLSGIVDLNIAHYQVTADKRKNLHIHSGGLLCITSKLSVAEWNDANPNGITVAADSGVFLGDGGNAQLLQLEASSQSQAEIESIQNQAVAVGAKMVTIAGGNETATAARISASGESSVLSSVASNAGEAIENALISAARFVSGANPDDVQFRLNDDFFDEGLTAQDAMALIQLGDRGLVAINDQRAKLRGTGWLEADRTDEDIDNDVANQNTGL